MAFGNSLKDRSYDVRVGRGDEVELLEPLTRTIDSQGSTVFRDYPIGTRCVVLAESNAGFRGVEASFIVLEDGYTFYHVSTGKLRLLSTKED